MCNRLKQVSPTGKIFRLTAAVFACLILLAPLMVSGQGYINAVKGTYSGSPLYVYITGDGGWNSFNKGVVDELGKHGNHVLAINSKKYFWDKKTPEQTAHDLEPLIRKYKEAWGAAGVVMVGYSFGASVVPFVTSRLPAELRKHIVRMVCLSPTPYAAFEVTVSTMLNLNRKPTDYPVLAELEKLKQMPILFVFGKKGEEEDIRAFRAAGITSELLEGSHSYNNDFEAVVRKITR